MFIHLDVPAPTTIEEPPQTEDELKDEKQSELEKLERDKGKSTSTKYEINEYYVRCK